MNQEIVSSNQQLSHQTETASRLNKHPMMRLLAAASLFIGGALQSESHAYASGTDLNKINAGETVCTPVGHPGDFAIINATITQPEQDGYATVHKSTADWRASSTNNFATGQTIPNLTITEIGADSKSCITPSVRTHAIEDLSGFLLARAVSPAGPNGAVRVLDTRQVNGLTGGRKLAAGETKCVDLGHAGDFAIINSTITQPDQNGFATIHKSTADWRASSTNNFATGQTIPNLTITEIGADGKSCITPVVATHSIVDVQGYISSQFMSPAGPNGAVRVLDTRQANGPTSGSKIEAGQNVCVDVGHPGDFAVINATITEPEQDGYATVHKSTANWQTSSTNNFIRGQTIPNLTITEIGADGKICIASVAKTHAIEDLLGYLDGGTDGVVVPASLDGALRILDTRLDNPPTQSVKLISGGNVVGSEDIIASCKNTSSGILLSSLTVKVIGLTPDTDPVYNNGTELISRTTLDGSTWQISSTSRANENGEAYFSRTEYSIQPTQWAGMLTLELYESNQGGAMRDTGTYKIVVPCVAG